MFFQIFRKVEYQFGLEMSQRIKDLLDLDVDPRKTACLEKFLI